MTLADSLTPQQTHLLIIKLGAFVISGLIGCAVWQHYRKASHPIYLKYSTFWPRFFSRCVDGCVFMPLTGVIAILSITLSVTAPVLASLQLVYAITWAVYVVEMHRRYGQTLGKMVCKVKLVDNATETAVTAKQAYLREGIPLLIGAAANLYFIYLVGTGRIFTDPAHEGKKVHILQDPVYLVATSVPLIWFVIEVVTMLFNEKRRALHDFIAKTVIIRTSVTEAPPLP